VEPALQRQAEALERRVVGSGLYTDEPAEFAAACEAYRLLWAPLELSEDLGSLATEASRHVVRRVRRRDGTEGVLKITGHTRQPGEGEVLSAWFSLGLPCVEPLRWGHARAPSERGYVMTTYLLTRFADLPTLPRTTHGWSLERRIRLALDLTRFIRPFHDARVSVTCPRSWEDRLRSHLRWTFPLVEAHGWTGPPGWEETLMRLGAPRGVVLHGDPAGSNVLVRDDGRFVLLDPAGAIRGLREADVAQICSQVGGADAVVDVIAAVCDDDATLDRRAVAALAGLNFLTWAGYFLASHGHPDARPDRAGDETLAARRYLDTAEGLLSRPPL
jgi:hypothetical protein